ncbi:response regulator [[Limnothrix rosea] IAM M-220]|uniref:response regulator n=1 Tax=[Limnothrix rosea] IAM M-220 TaxID=454133 RepID=UPI000964C21F|nr:response regulator [[Limnothrix rosea] IAM M-220]OKH19422.1 hypothetical protein NIES208_02610 [[Limnothrix rosea] IAM M-220]
MKNAPRYAPSPQMTVLVIEDQMGYRELICEAIADLFLDVMIWSAKDGQDAWDLLTSSLDIDDAKKCHPDLVITDLNMPRSSGLDFLKRLRKTEYFKTIPVIIFSTSKDEFDIVSCYEAQANCFVTKPADIDTFFEVVQSIVKFWFGIATLPTKIII